MPLCECRHLRLVTHALVVWLLVTVPVFSTNAPDTKPLVVITVGLEKADIVGNDNVAIQKAIDRAAAAGGGTVHIKAGTYTLYNSVRLASHLTLEGDGADKTILKKCAYVQSRVTIDADATESQAMVENTRGFQPGMGVVVYDRGLWQGMYPAVKTLARIDGRTLFFDDIVRVDHPLERSPIAINCFPMIAGLDVEGVHLRNLAVDGNRSGKEAGDEISLVDPAAILFFHAKNFSVRGIVARNYVGDGISVWYVEDPVIEDCESYGNASLGIHLGSKALRAQVRHNRSHNNGHDGLYLCWSVKGGTFEDNQCLFNDRDGISIGHKDTDNVFLKNVVRENGQAGIYLRDEPESTAGHRNTFRENVIENNGRLSSPGYGVRIDGATQHISLLSNTIRDTRQGAQARQDVGIFIGPRADYVVCEHNTFSGDLRQKIDDQSKGGHNKLE